MHNERCMSGSERGGEKPTAETAARRSPPTPHLRVIVPTGLNRSAQKRLLSHVKAEVLDRLHQQEYDIPDQTVKAGNENRYIAILLSYESLYPPDQALRPELLIEISARSPILTPVECGYDTIVNELLGRAERSGSIACLDIRETIAGKNAALLRRWSARRRPGIRAGQRPR